VFWRVLACSSVFWRVLVCSGGVLGRSRLFYDMWVFWRFLACSCVFWRVPVFSGGVLGRSGLAYDMLRVLAFSGVFWGCSGAFWAVL
jgi:hypothetical protein